MVDTLTPSVVSPDGRFEAAVEKTVDFLELYYDLVLTERATGKRLLTCHGTLRAEFAEDGTLIIHHPGYEPRGVQVDPVRRVFRTRPSEPWAPLDAWQMVEAAFERGWAEGVNNFNHGRKPLFPWVSVLLLLSSAVTLLALEVWPPTSKAAQTALLLVAGSGGLLFGWLTARDFNFWMQARKLSRSQSAIGRSPRPE